MSSSTEIAVQSGVAAHMPGEMSLLRLATIGSVDDGKSTLIGRLLCDARQLFDDQVEAVAVASRAAGMNDFDLAMVTDGLRSEREQGITIDVAYRYAATPTRKFIIADCPGHLQYTRNMATGCSTADLALVVVDVTAGLGIQTRRHLCIAALLGVRRVVVAVNKMDIVDWEKGRFDCVAEETRALLSRLGFTDVTLIPISALRGGNVVDQEPLDWYQGPTLLHALERADISASDEPAIPWRLPVQWVLRHPDGRRSYAGMVARGTVTVGDAVLVGPRQAARVVAIDGPGGRVDAAGPGISASIFLSEDVDLGRGDMMCSADSPAAHVSDFSATLCWFGERPLTSGDRFFLKHTTRETRAVITKLCGVLDVEKLGMNPVDVAQNNDIVMVEVSVSQPLALDAYAVSRSTGAFILMEEGTGTTVGAGMVGSPSFF